LNLLDLFHKTFDNKPAIKEEASSRWITCKSCHSTMYYKEVENQNYVCPKCGYHIRIGVKERIELLADEGTFIEYDASLEPVDPINFVDKKPYKQRIEEGFKKTGRKSSVVAGSCQMNGVSAQVVIFDFAFMGGSLGSVEGEKIVRAVGRAIENREGLVILSASGGARMQESTFSLLQMSKTSAALAKLAKHNLPYISVLTDPTMGGVSASFATLGDIIIAEPGALIGFAGARVIEQTIGSALPDDFQRAEFLLEKGSVDMIVNRNELKKTLSDIFTLLKV